MKNKLFFLSFVVLFLQGKILAPGKKKPEDKSLFDYQGSPHSSVDLNQERQEERYRRQQERRQQEESISTESHGEKLNENINELLNAIGENSHTENKENQIFTDKATHDMDLKEMGKTSENLNYLEKKKYINQIMKSIENKFKNFNRKLFEIDYFSSVLINHQRKNLIQILHHTKKNEYFSNEFFSMEEIMEKIIKMQYCKIQHTEKLKIQQFLYIQKFSELFDGLETLIEKVNKFLTKFKKEYFYYSEIKEKIKKIQKLSYINMTTHTTHSTKKRIFRKIKNIRNMLQEDQSKTKYIIKKIQKKLEELNHLEDIFGERSFDMKEFDNIFDISPEENIFFVENEQGEKFQIIDNEGAGYCFDFSAHLNELYPGETPEKVRENFINRIIDNLSNPEIKNIVRKEIEASFSGDDVGPFREQDSGLPVATKEYIIKKYKEEYRENRINFISEECRDYREQEKDFFKDKDLSVYIDMTPENIIYNRDVYQFDFKHRISDKTHDILMNKIIDDEYVMESYLREKYINKRGYIKAVHQNDDGSIINIFPIFHPDRLLKIYQRPDNLCSSISFLHAFKNDNFEGTPVVSCILFSQINQHFVELKLL